MDPLVADLIRTAIHMRKLSLGHHRNNIEYMQEKLDKEQGYIDQLVAEIAILEAVELPPEEDAE